MNILVLSELLAEEINSFGQFCLLLREEREALARLDQEMLDPIISRKQLLCEHLSQLAEQRRQQLGRADMASELQRLGLTAEWDKLTALAREARELNRINGTIIDARLQHNQQAMALLRAGEDVASTYGPEGLSQNSSSARHLGSA